ncbi:hypothetical protein Tco_0322918 [Tanacetum coccineum]
MFVDLTQDDTKTPSPKLPNSSPSAPNAPSKTPSTKDTSSSSIDYIPKSPTSSTSPSPNGYLNPSTSPPPRVSPPPPTQDNASMDITLTLSPNTPLDVQFDTPSPSPPIIAHPIPWNFLEAHDITLPLGEHLDTLSMGDREINFNPSRDIEELEHLLVDDPVPVPRVFDEPLGNSDSMSRSSETTYLFEELIAEFGLDDSIPTKIDDRYHNTKGDILYFEHLLNEDTSSDVSPALLPIESSSLDLPLLDPKQICLREVERFDPFFSLTQSGGKTRVMETPSFGFHHMPSPRPAAYSPKEVMYRYYHPHLTLGDGFDHGPKMK